MECREALELLNDEIDGRVSPADAARLAEHVAACSACAQVRDELASLRAAFRAVPKDAAPADFRAGVMASLPRGSVRSLPRTLGWIVAVAAVLVVAVTLIPGGRGAAEKDLAGVPAKSAAEGRADHAAGPAPEIAAPSAATPVAPPRPGFVAGDDREGRDKSAGAAGSRENKTLDEDSEKDRGAEKDAGGLVSLKEEAARAEDDESATTRSRAAAPAASVRYLVFRDAASAAKFTESLAAVELAAKKYKEQTPAKAPAAPAPTDAPPPASGGGGGGGGFAAPAPAPKQSPRQAEEERRADLWKQGAFQSRRVVSRTALPDGVADADLAARVAAAGGAIVPAAEAEKFAELLDAPSPAPLPDPAPAAGATAQSAPAAKADKDAADEARKKQPAPPAEGKFEAERKPVVLVIVVLEPPAGDKK